MFSYNLRDPVKHAILEAKKGAGGKDTSRLFALHYCPMVLGKSVP